jgi:hypothetical protein
LIEVVLHGGGKASDADRGDDASVGSSVGKSQASDVLAHVVESIRSARPGPVRPGIIGKVEAGFRASDNVITVTRIDPYLAHRLVLRELTRRLCQAWSKHVRSQKRPSNTGIG